MKNNLLKSLKLILLCLLSNFCTITLIGSDLQLRQSSNQCKYSPQQVKIISQFDSYLKGYSLTAVQWNKAKQLIIDSIEQHNIDPNDISFRTSVDRESALEVALHYEKQYSPYPGIDFINYLLERKANPDLTKGNVLGYASSRSSFLACLLLHKANVHQELLGRRTIMHAACGLSCELSRFFSSLGSINPKTLLLLYRFGAKPDEADINGVTPLMIACYWGTCAYDTVTHVRNTENVKNLIKMGASLQKQITQPCNPIDTFCNFSKGEDCMAMIQHGLRRGKYAPDDGLHKDAIPQSVAIQSAIVEAQKDVADAIDQRKETLLAELQRHLYRDLANVVIAYTREDHVIPNLLAAALSEIDEEITTLVKHISLKKLDADKSNCVVS